MANVPKSICILRLSAIGDVSHMIPVARTIQNFWPETQLTWVIGKHESNLIKDFQNIEFIVFDKSKALDSYKKIVKHMKQRSFEVLICAQVSMRANIIAKLISAETKLGFDAARSKDLHSLVINQSIEPVQGQHVLDSFFSFIEYLGLNEREMRWDYIIGDEDLEFANQHLDTERFNLIISPCSSHSKRNWSAERYASVADYAIKTINANVILCGGPSNEEIQMGQAIEAYMQYRAVNLIGKDTLKKLIALLQGADALISPDSGPAHLATGVNTPVVGLYAASSSKRSGPYFSQKWCVDKYDVAARKFRNKPADALKWGTKLEYSDVMQLIEIEDVTQMLNKLYQYQTNK